LSFAAQEPNGGIRDVAEPGFALRAFVRVPARFFDAGRARDDIRTDVANVIVFLVFFLAGLAGNAGRAIHHSGFDLFPAVFTDFAVRAEPVTFLFILEIMQVFVLTFSTGTRTLRARLEHRILLPAFQAGSVAHGALFLVVSVSAFTFPV
jgi:hypothetical protein